MDSFENIMGWLLEQEGYWIRHSFKVNLTDNDKKRLGKPNMPRPEIDLIAYNPQDNEVLAVECKSWLDSAGVRWKDIICGGEYSRFKLFCNQDLCTVVFERLLEQLAEKGACAPSATVKLCLATGHIANERPRVDIQKEFAGHGWKLFDEEWIGRHIVDAEKSGYQDHVATIVAKLIIRNPDWLKNARAGS
jgi:hypothetical protein